MKIHRFEDAPPPGMAAALERFERQFTYPLGAGRRFHISHGEDYPRFFRAIGGAGAGASFVAEGDGGEILGTLGMALRPMQLPGGEVAPTAYLGDLKTAPDPRRARTLVALAARAYSWGREHGATAAYGVVMDGTPRSPSTYSGRFGIPAFGAVGKVCVLRLAAPSIGMEEDAAFETCSETVESRYRALSANRFAPLGGGAKERSINVPVFLATPDGCACGVLEDTRCAKRLMLDDGSEMVSAHLSKFAYANVSAGASLLRQALARCWRRALAPALFVSVPEVDTVAFVHLLKDGPDIVQAPATIYAAGFTSSAHPWNLSTAEI
jgi:hypothetical protein